MNKDFLSKETCLGLRGILALFVLFHHIYQFTGIFSGTPLKFLFLNLGQWAVAGFVFMSGYGLYTSLKIKGNAYIKAFPRKRILSFYLKYLVFVLFYFLYDLAIGSYHTAPEIIKTLTYGSTIVSFGWYLQLNFALYVVFWLIFRFAKNRYLRSSLFLTVFLAYTALYIYLGMSLILYTPVFFFGFGMITAIHSESFLRVSKVQRILLMVSGFIVFVLGFGLVWKLGLSDRSWIAALLTVAGGLGELVFLIFFTEALRNTRIFKNPFVDFLGTYSLEIYCCQGLVLRTLNLLSLPVPAFILLGLTITVLVAVPVHKLLSLKFFR